MRIKKRKRSGKGGRNKSLWRAILETANKCCHLHFYRLTDKSSSFFLALSISIFPFKIPFIKYHSLRVEVKSIKTLHVAKNRVFLLSLYSAISHFTPRRNKSCVALLLSFPPIHLLLASLLIPLTHVRLNCCSALMFCA